MNLEIKHRQLKNLIAWSLFTGVAIGFFSGFMPPNIQPAIWGLNAFFIIIGASLLGSKLGRLDHDIPAAGFVVLTVANALAYGFLATHDVGEEQFGASIFIYFPAMLLISLSDLMPMVFRILGFISAIAFGILAMTIYFDNCPATLHTVLTITGYTPMNIVEFAWGWSVLKGKI